MSWQWNGYYYELGLLSVVAAKGCLGHCFASVVSLQLTKTWRLLQSSLIYIYIVVIFCFLVLLIHYGVFWYIVINKDPKMLMFVCFEVWVSAKTALFHHLVHLVCFCAACLHKPLILLLLHISWLKLQYQEVAYDLFLLTLDECYSFILLLNWTSLKMDR